jgi:hypothetical protein
MSQIMDFETVILEEVGFLLDLPISSEKVQIFSKEAYEENREIRCYALADQLILMVPPSLMTAVIHSTKNSNFNKEQPLEALKKILDLKNHRYEYETGFLFLKSKNHYIETLDASYSISQINDDMTETFEIFKNECTQEDLDEGLVSIKDSLVLGCFHEEKLIGVASYWFLAARLDDIGVIIHPDFRRKGIGKALVSKLCQWGINHGKINMYRHDKKTIIQGN